MKTSIFFLLLLVSALSTQVSAQHVFQGTVTNDLGQPVAGATVLIPGSELSTQSDLNGWYRLRYSRPCTDLLFQSPNHRNIFRRQVCATDTINVTLQRISPISYPEMELTEDQAQPSYGELRTAGAAPSRKLKPRLYPATFAVEPGVVHNTEDYAVIAENRFYRPSDQALSTFSIDVDAAAYSNVRRFLKNGQKPPKDAVRIEELINYFDYDYPQPSEEQPFYIETELSQCPWQPNHQLLHVGLQGKRIPYDDLPPSNLVFLIDVSGSMNQPNKLPLLQSALQLLTDQLRSQDRVAIVVYAGAAGTVLESTSGDKKQTIKEAIRQLQAGGATAGNEGIKLAYEIARKHLVENGNNRVILATDGDFNVGPSSDAAMQRLIEQQRESGIFLTVLGFGMGNYKDNKMQILADKGNGNHAYIDDLSEARKVLVHEFGGTLFTIAKDVKIQIEFNPAQVAGYRLIGYENRLLDAEDFNDDTKDAGELGSGHTVTALYEIIPAGVESDFLGDIDDLKYQKRTADPSDSQELAQIKFRYKMPDGDQSQLLERTILAKAKRKTSDAFRWSAAVASFGMLLRDSEFKGQSAFEKVIELAQSAQGKDREGYRAEFIRLVENARDIMGETEEVRAQNK